MQRLSILAALLPLIGFSDTIAQAPKKQPPKEFTNSIGMKFVWIPAGTFVMGSPLEEKDRAPSETQHRVTLTEGFYIGQYAVTQEQWQTVMGANPSFFKGDKTLPVETVSWVDSQEFLQKLGQKDGRIYRLPTEAEWEYACRAGTKTPFHFGEVITTDQANFNGNLPYKRYQAGVFRNKTTPVGSFPGNAWGLYDMHGNVWQWCHDWLEDYPQNPVVDPNRPAPESPHTAAYIKQLSSSKFAERQAATNALSKIGLHALPLLREAARDAPDLETHRRVEQLIAGIVKKGEGRVVRGGSFNIEASSMRSAFRFRLAPTYRTYNVGFRAVMLLKEE